MIETDSDTFENLITEALDSLPGEHVKQIKNVAITWADNPSPLQRTELQLRNDQTLFGLARRQGATGGLIPDKITLFRGPLSASVHDIAGLKEQIRHTLWHEIAHYYGLNHDRIHELE
jgi:predicted Zn-dependent protease with MMP-like domain